MANPKPHTTEQSATARLEAARKVKDAAIARELAWVAIAVRARIWPAWVSPPRVAQSGMPYILHIDTPAGRLIYRLKPEEMDPFRDLAERPNDGLGGSADEKLPILLHLATEGW